MPLWRRRDGSIAAACIALWSWLRSRGGCHGEAVSRSAAPLWRAHSRRSTRRPADFARDGCAELSPETHCKSGEYFSEEEDRTQCWACECGGGDRCMPLKTPDEISLQNIFSFSVRKSVIFCVNYSACRTTAQKHTEHKQQQNFFNCKLVCEMRIVKIKQIICFRTCNYDVFYRLLC